MSELTLNFTPYNIFENCFIYTFRREDFVILFKSHIFRNHPTFLFRLQTKDYKRHSPPKFSSATYSVSPVRRRELFSKLIHETFSGKWCNRGERGELTLFISDRIHPACMCVCLCGKTILKVGDSCTCERRY